MERSEQIDKLAAALAKFQGELEQPKMNCPVEVQTSKGKYTFKYADFAECKAAARKPLADNELAVTQLIEEDYSLLTMLVHSSGQWIASRVKMPVMQQGAQAVGSAITYAKRYSFCAILGIVADEDDDGNTADGNTMQRKPSAKPSAPAKRAFDLKLLEREDFFPKIYNYEQEAKKQGKAFSVRAFLESLYRINEDAIQQAEALYSDYKINNSLA